METINLEENWTRFLENFVKKSVLVILNSRINLISKSSTKSVNSEVLIIFFYFFLLKFLVFYK